MAAKIWKFSTQNITTFNQYSRKIDKKICKQIFTEENLIKTILNLLT